MLACRQGDDCPPPPLTRADAPSRGRALVSAGVGEALYIMPITTPKNNDWAPIQS